MRNAGYDGFSFCEPAAEVGIKSASVDHYVPSKASMAAAGQGVTGTGSLSVWKEDLGTCCALSRSFGSAKRDMGTGRTDRFHSQN